MNQRSDSPGLPTQPFFSTPQQRLALARQRYFEEGVRPSGLVSEGVIQSWARCLQAQRRPDEAITFATVTASRAHSAVTRARVLLAAAANELSQLESTLAGTCCTVLLTDPHGVVVHSARAGYNADEVLLPLARRVGCNLAEDSIGTNAPGMTAHTGEASVVLGGEHFFGSVQVMHCAAAPIRDIHGQVAGVLDVTSESRPFGFDAASVVGLYATAIENRLLRAQSAEHIVVHLQTSPALLGTPMEGLAGITSDGRIAWMNRAATRLLGMARITGEQQADAVFALGMDSLAALTRRSEASAHRLPNGLSVWLLARMQARDGARQVVHIGAPADAAAGSVAAPAAPVAADASDRAAVVEPLSGTLRNSELNIITRTLRACDGNVSKAARQLGVSRGLVYRHLKQVAEA